MAQWMRLPSERAADRDRVRNQVVRAKDDGVVLNMKRSNRYLEVAVHQVDVEVAEESKYGKPLVAPKCDRCGARHGSAPCIVPRTVPQGFTLLPLVRIPKTRAQRRAEKR